MKNRKYLFKYFVRSFIVIGIFLVLFFLIERVEYNSYKQNTNYKLSAILEKVKEKYISK